MQKERKAIGNESKLLFVCSGNVGRSQMAEAYYNYFTNSNNACSAGTDKTTPKKYPCIDPIIQKVMLEDGIDVSEQYVKTITRKMVEEADIIYILCDKSLCPDYLVSSNKINFWRINDPFSKDINFTREVRDNIKKKVKSLLVY